jgi:hypothetical protein
VASRIISDGKGAIWVASTQQGILKIQNNKVVQAIAKENGLSSNHCKRIQLDSNGLIPITIGQNSSNHAYFYIEGNERINFDFVVGGIKAGLDKVGEFISPLIEKIKSFFKDPETKKAINGFPSVSDEDRKGYKTDDWKIFFIQILEMVLDIGVVLDLINWHLLKMT